ncbi:MAG TPA: ABC transporter permease [Methanobacterium sp.]|nr:MAG: ABC transporter permease [Methanobacterium sp.]HOI70802.1 ABC transporter permease [Methanobacterium sp.]
MKFLSLAIKDLKELVRDRKGLFFILVFPIFFMLVFGFAFGGMGQSNTPYKLAIVNHDSSVNIPMTGESVNFGKNLTQILEEAQYENSDVHLFNVTKVSESQAEELLKTRNIDVALIIPDNFSESVLALINHTILSATNPLVASGSTTPEITSTLIIRGDTGFMNFGVSQGILVGILAKYQDEIVTQTQNEVRATPGAQPKEFLKSKVEPIEGTQNFTSFDFIAPGMIVFAIIFLATTVAANFTREVESGTLTRLKLTRMKGFDILFGGLIPWSLVVVFQVIILLAVAIAIGFHWQGGVNSILLAILVGVIGGIASIALGMIISAFVQNVGQAGNLGTLITVPASFLVGAFFPLPDVEIFGVPFNAFLPWTHTLDALRALLTYGGGWNEIAYSVGVSVFLTVILFAIGVVLFTKNRLKAES